MVVGIISAPILQDHSIDTALDQHHVGFLQNYIVKSWSHWPDMGRRSMRRLVQELNHEVSAFRLQIVQLHCRPRDHQKRVAACRILREGAGHGPRRSKMQRRWQARHFQADMPLFLATEILQRGYSATLPPRASVVFW